MTGILGKKIGMTNIFNEEGHFVPVTVIEAGPCSVLGTRTKDTAGYSAVVLGFGEEKPKKVTKPQKGWFDKLKISPKKVVKEIRVADPPACKVGDTVNVSIFKVGDYVDITGTSIGKGFQGVIKRYGWHGGESGHGSMFHRAPGSLSASSFPSRVFKGHGLPGHMGNDKQTVQSLKVVSVVEEKNILLVKGSVPGHKDSLVILRHAIKRSPKEATAAGKETEKEGGTKAGDKEKGKGK